MGCPILYDYQSMVTGICDVRLSQRKRLGMWKALCRTSKEPVYRQQVTSPYASVRPYQRDVTRALVAKGFTHLCLRLCPAGVGLLNDTGFYSFLLQIVTEGAARHKHKQRILRLYGFALVQDGMTDAVLVASITVDFFKPRCEGGMDVNAAIIKYL